MAPSSRLFLALLGFFSAAEAKVESGTVRLGSADGESPWHYMGKFGYAVGAGSYDVRLRLRAPPQEVATVNLEVFLDEDWARAERLPACRRALSGPARKTMVLRAAGDEWSVWTGGTLEQTVRSHIWYFALSKCTGHQMGNMTLEVDYELRSLQYDSSELSVELRYMPAATVVSVLCLTGYLVYFALHCWRFQQNVGMVHPVIRTLAGAVLLQWTAQVMHLSHLLAYEHDGLGFASLEVTADMLFMLSQVASATLLIVIAQGYTLLQAKEAELSAFKPVAALVALLHLVLVGHGKFQGDHSEKHHENEGVVGWALLVVRLLLFVWFAIGVRVLKQTGGFRLQHFLNRFQIAGSLYFLSYPAIFLIVQVFAPYMRHPILTIGLVIMQLASSFWLSDLFFSRGAYYEVSTLSGSLLPGGAGGSSPVGWKSE